MDHKIRKLLQKKKLTGQEFGKALITTRVHEAINNESILTTQELKSLSAKVEGQSEITQGNAYVNFHAWINRYSTLANVYHEKFYVGYSRLFFRLFYTIEAEQFLGSLQKLNAKSRLENNNNDYQRLQNFSKESLSSFSIFSDLDNKEVVQFMQDGQDVIREALIKLLAYNKAVDLFTRFLKLPDFSRAFKINIEAIAENISSLNDKITQLKNLLSKTNEEIEKKRRFLDDIYPQINITDYEPTLEAIEEASNCVEEAILSSKPYEKIIRILQRRL